MECLLRTRNNLPSIHPGFDLQHETVMVMYTCNPSTLEVEAGGSKAQGVLRYIGSSSQLGVLDTLSKKKKSLKVWLIHRERELA